MTKRGSAVMLADGIDRHSTPHRGGDRGLQDGQVEYRHRCVSDNEMLELATLVETLKQRSAQNLAAIYQRLRNINGVDQLWLRLAAIQ
ncbi:MAG: hypothetical protein R3E67_06520 [Pseudomonadales bacterium]